MEENQNKQRQKHKNKQTKKQTKTKTNNKQKQTKKQRNKKQTKKNNNLTVTTITYRSFCWQITGFVEAFFLCSYLSISHNSFCTVSGFFCEKQLEKYEPWRKVDIFEVVSI